MSSVDIEIVSMPNLRKIESFINDSTYRETIEISSNFNARLCMERKSRNHESFVDAQTGVAQRSCHLYAHRRQRMPALREGQIYSYPSQRWRKPKRQYLMRMQNTRPFRNFKRVDGGGGVGGITSDSIISEKLSGTSMQLEDSLSSSYSGMLNEGEISKDGGTSKGSEDLPKDWLYDELDMNDIDGMDDADQADSDFEYNVNGYKRKTSGNRRRAKGSGGNSRRSRSDAATSGDGTPRRSRNPAGSGSRRRRKPADKLPKEPDLETDTYTPAFEPSAFDVPENNFELRNYRKNVW